MSAEKEPTYERSTEERFAKFVVDHMSSVKDPDKDGVFGPVALAVEEPDQLIPIKEVTLYIAPTEDLSSPILNLSLLADTAGGQIEVYGISWGINQGFDLSVEHDLHRTDEQEVNRLLDIIEAWESQGRIVPHQTEEK